MKFKKINENLSQPLDYKEIEFFTDYDPPFTLWYPDLKKFGIDADETYLATNAKRHLHINIQSELQGKGLANILIKALIYREGYFIIPFGRITSPYISHVMEKIKLDPKFNVDILSIDDGDDEDGYIIYEA